jgi:biotin operon repressor
LSKQNQEHQLNSSDELLMFLKAMADANRLKILGLLSKQPCTVEQLAALLGLGASTISHHLSKLSDAGLVSATAQSYYNYYRLEKDRYEQMALRLLPVENLSALVTSVDDTAYDRKVVGNYLLPDGRLKTLPAQQKKLQAVLRHVVQMFEPGQRYSEKEVNEMLGRLYPDTASLRRELVGYKLMDREGGGGEYWRIE